MIVVKRSMVLKTVYVIGRGHEEAWNGEKEGSKKNPAALKVSAVGLLSRDQALSKDRSPAL